MRASAPYKADSELSAMNRGEIAAHANGPCPRNSDSRGNRRYFTIASAPADDTVRLGVRLAPNGSAFKRGLAQVQPGDEIVASQLAGNFTLPRNKQRKLAVIAGGTGITPFRSMLDELLEHRECGP
jgi:ferredoxin-NADP reductase